MIHTKEFDYEIILSPKPKKKLMVVLHGRGDSLNAFRYFDEELQIPGMNYLLINAPRRYLDGYTWYAFPPKQAKGVLLARKKLFKMMNELEAQGWNSRDIFFFGFSQGCLVSCDFGMHYPKPLGGIIGVSGYIYFFKNWRKEITKAAYKTPWLITHGLRDDALSLQETREDVTRLRQAKLPILWKEFDKDHEIELETEAPFIRKWVMQRM